MTTERGKKILKVTLNVLSTLGGARTITKTGVYNHLRKKVSRMSAENMGLRKNS